MNMLSVISYNLCIASSTSNKLCSSIGSQLNIVDKSTNWDFIQWKSITNFNLCFFRNDKRSL